MNREIKFRGLNDNNEWIYGYLFKETDGQYEIIFTDEIGDVNFENVKSETLGQYTGLKDKNGVEIYEGDILVRQQYWGKDKSGFSKKIIKWNEKNCGFNITSRSKGFVVIGNIYENKDLLEVEE